MVNKGQIYGELENFSRCIQNLIKFDEIDQIDVIFLGRKL